MHELNTPLLWLPLLAGALGLLCLWGAARMASHRHLIDGLPTCKTTGVFIGLVEVKGTAEAEQPLTSHLAAVSCVHYDWKVEEHWSRTVTESYTDSNGKRQTRTRRESGWKTVDSGGETIPFYLRDDHGVLLVRPEGARLEPVEVFQTTCGRGDPLYYGKGPPGAVSHSDHRRRFSEVALPLHTEVYVLGKAREREDVVAAEVAADPTAPLFLISARREEHISRGYRWKFWLLTLLGLLITTAGPGFVLQEATAFRGLPPWLPFGGGALAYVLAAVLMWIWTTYNNLVDLRNRVASAWSQIDVQLRRRFDLIPRLEQVVKGVRGHEREVQTELAALRSQVAATPPDEAGPDYQALGGGLRALAESYPELTANGAFLELQTQLSDTEQRIALARGYYNEIATHYNTRLEVFPEHFLARCFGMKSRQLMAVNDFERAPVAVKLAD